MSKSDFSASLDSNFTTSPLQIARNAGKLISPNPAVGCIISGKKNQLLGNGHTQPPGQAHAEVMALRDAAARGLSVEGATVYVTLEPCSHYGRTPPCCNALIDAKVGKVVVAILDPNPLVSGRGVQMLRDAGITVEVLPVDSAEAVASRELNIGFFSRMVRKTPWVRMKVAASLDGQTALADGSSQWITGEAARADGHAWRARSCAVLTGIGTVLQDDPLLNVRHIDALTSVQRQPHLVIVDSKLATPLNAKLFATNNIAGRAIYIYAAARNDAKKQALEALGAKVIYMPESGVGKPGALMNAKLDSTNVTPQKVTSPKVDLRAMMLDLGQREINELHVEAGFKLNGSLINAGVVDELVLYVAPKMLGSGGMGIANMQALGSLGNALQLDFQSTERVGDDLRIVARVRGRDRF